MTNTTINLPDPLQQYVIEHSLREAPVLARLRQVTAALPQAGLQIAPEQGQFMQLLVRLLGAKRCLEIGTLTGYSALAVALALPGDGELVTCDVSVEWTQIARQFWREAGVDARIDLRLAPALATLDALLSSGSGSSFDFAFIDADKGNYANYYAEIVERLAPRGVLLVDNVLWSGKVIDPAVDDGDTVALRAFNELVQADPRVHAVMLPIADGLTLVRRRD